MSKKAVADQLGGQRRPGQGQREARRAAVEAYAAKQGIEIVGEEYDASVSGADPLEAREGFVVLLSRLAGGQSRRCAHLARSGKPFATSVVARMLRS
jgi:hypothetical protein